MGALIYSPSNGSSAFSGGSAGLIRVLFSPDGKLIVTAGDDDINGTVRIWDANTGKQLHSLPGLTVRIWAIALSPDGKYLATGGWGGVLKVWDVATGMEFMDLPGNTSTVGSVAFSADGKWIASAGTGIKIWNSVTGEELLSLPGGDLLVLFNRAGTRLFTIGDDGVHLYALRIEDLIAIAKSRVTRSLTAEECQTYLHMDECPSEP